ncbi:MAG: hypothetical protein ACI9G1_003034 [Pirellulaceae bacterium]|jgi:hypothetical protein
MARKVVNRKALREEAEAAEKQAPKKKAKTKRKSRAKDAADIRMKLYWGVFNQSMKRVALYDFSQKKEADKKAADLGASGKSPHFVQKVKEVVEE